MPKKCCCCQDDKDEQEFYRNASNKDGLAFICKDCYHKPARKKQLETYLHPRYYKMFIADCYATISSKADKLTQILLNGKK